MQNRHLLLIIVGLGLAASSVLYLLVAGPVAAAQTEQSSAVFDADGKLELPTSVFASGFLWELP